MPKKNRFLSTTASPKVNSKVNKIKLPPAPNSPPNKKNNSNKNSITWLQEAFNSARGETSLWVAVITQAMMDALSRSKKSEAVYHKHEAICWLTGNSRDFADVCLAAGMNPDYVRRKAKQVMAAPRPWRAEAGKGKRYLERKEYRRKQNLKQQEQQAVDDDQPKVISIF